MRQLRGWHLLLDGYANRSESLGAERIQALFDTLVRNLGMKYLGEPTCRRVELDHKKLSTDEDEGGYSYIAPITTSHIAIHCWPLRKAFMLDIFSCKKYDMEQAIKTICLTLDVRRYEVRCIERIGPVEPNNEN